MNNYWPYFAWLAITILPLKTGSQEPGNMNPESGNVDNVAQSQDGQPQETVSSPVASPEMNYPPPNQADQPSYPINGNPGSYSAPMNSYPPEAFQPNPNLGEQEQEFLQKHRENAARGNKAAKAVKRGSTENKPLAKSTMGLLNVDYVDEPILDVLRAIATAFRLSLIPDKDLGDVKVTIHLENIPVLEGLEKLCKSHGLEMTADGNVYRVRKTRETTFSLIEIRNKRMNLDLQNRSVKDFLREFVEKTKINIVPGQDLRGQVTGHLKDVEPIDGFKALMEANNYTVRLKNGVYLVENGDSVTRDGQGFGRSRRNAGYPNQGQGNSDVDVHDGRVTLTLNNASLGDALKEIAEQAGLNYTIIGDVSGNVNAQLKGVTVDEALSSLLQGTRYAYLRREGTLLIGDRNPNTPSGQALSGAELVYLKFIKAENIERIIPKSIPGENIKVIKEQNAVLISGTSDDIAQVKNFLEIVDVTTPQVLMEVVVVEYNRTQGSEFGLDNGLSGVKPALNMKGSMSGYNQTWKQGSFQASIGIKPPNFEFTLRALESKSKAKILSMPKITTLNGNKADLKVSRTSYFKVSSLNKDGFQNNDFRTIDDGITIELTPWITKHGEVNVTIAPSIKTSEIVGDQDSPPRVTNRSINTNVSLMDGETIALGGLINSTQSNSRKFVPILGSIPILGYLFSSRNIATTTQELVIYVTPHILNPEAQNVNLEEEFQSLDKRSGFLKNSDFLKGSKAGAARIEAKNQDQEVPASSPKTLVMDTAKTSALDLTPAPQKPIPPTMRPGMIPMKPAPTSANPSTMKDSTRQ